MSEDVTGGVAEPGAVPAGHGSRSSRSSRGARWRWLPVRPVLEGRDRHRWPGPLAAAGLTAGAALAVFGLPPVDLHGPLHYAGVMDPLCGGTRGVRATLVGDLSSAVEYNPASPLLVAGAPLALAREAYGRFRGRWLNLRLVHRRTAVGLALVLLAALWMRQQAHADLLQQSADRGLPTGLWLYAVGLPSAVLIAAGVALWRRVRPPG